MLVTQVIAPRQPAGWLQCRITVLFTVSDGAVQTQKVTAGDRQHSRILARDGWAVDPWGDGSEAPTYSPPSLMSFRSTTSNVAKCTLRDEAAAVRAELVKQLDQLDFRSESIGPALAQMAQHVERSIRQLDE